MEYDQNFGPAQQNMNVFSSNQLEEPAVPTLSIGRGRTTRSSRGRSNIIVSFYFFYLIFQYLCDEVSVTPAGKKGLAAVANSQRVG